jgi:hypothetical protein
VRLEGQRTGFLDLPDPPLSISLGPRPLPLRGGRALSAPASVRLFAHGIASVRFEVPLPAGADAATLAGLVRDTADATSIERAAREEATTVLRSLAPALHGPHESPLSETYAVVFARRLAAGAGPADVAGADLARILLGERPDAPLSEQTVADVTRHRFAYRADDLCVLDWDSAFVVEPAQDLDLPDVLELVSAQLLEFRYYDDLFERELLEGSRALGRRRRGLPFLSGRAGRDLRRLQHLVVESLEFVESVENAVRVVGDLYLARVYRAAVERFRIPAWQAGVVRRQQAAVQVAGMLRSEASAALGHWLEGTILALILLEILLAFLRGT